MEASSSFSSLTTRINCLPKKTNQSSGELPPESSQSRLMRFSDLGINAFALLLVKASKNECDIIIVFSNPLQS